MIGLFFNLSRKRQKKTIDFVSPLGWTGVPVHMQAPASVALGSI